MAEVKETVCWLVTGAWFLFLFVASRFQHTYEMGIVTQTKASGRKPRRMPGKLPQSLVLLRAAPPPDSDPRMLLHPANRTGCPQPDALVRPARP